MSAVGVGAADGVSLVTEGPIASAKPFVALASRARRRALANALKATALAEPAAAATNLLLFPITDLQVVDRTIGGRHEPVALGGA